MLKYRLIIEYYQKGNNKSQIATLCGCSRTTVWTLIKKIVEEKIEIKTLLSLSDKELTAVLFSERMSPSKVYLIPDYKWEELQMIKHQSSIRLCWRRYCKRAQKQNLVAYSWKSYLYFYQQYKRPKPDIDDPNDKVRTKLKRYNLYLSILSKSESSYFNKLKNEKEEWLKSLHLDEKKILDKKDNKEE